MEDLLNIGLVFSTIRLSAPLILAAIGGLYSERAGIINIALEGLMLAGAFTAATVTYFTGSPWIGLLAAIGAGMAVAAIHAVVCIYFGADQVVSGTAINILFLGVPALMSGALFSSSGSTEQLPRSQLLPITPIVIAFAMVPITLYVLSHTRFGLRLRAVGENPEAAETAGVSVARIRFAAVLISGALAAIRPYRWWRHIGWWRDGWRRRRNGRHQRGRHWVDGRACLSHLHADGAVQHGGCRKLRSQ